MFDNKSVTLTPAYGRDYTSAKAVLADYEAGKDFHVGVDGPYCSKRDFGPEVEVRLRYNKCQKVFILS